MRIKIVGVNLNKVFLPVGGKVTFSFLPHSFPSFFLFILIISLGSLGARINELKQRVIAENPHRYGIAVPRKSAFTDY